jgi:hypothetical protein
MLSLKEQGQSLYESTQSSSGLSGIGGLRASQPGGFYEPFTTNIEKRLCRLLCLGALTFR